MVFMLVKYLNPSSPHSLPYPEFFTPPNGRCVLLIAGLLMKTIPVSISLATLSALSKLVEITLPPSPYSESLASLIASSSLSTLKSKKTGPKNSYE